MNCILDRNLLASNPRAELLKVSSLDCPLPWIPQENMDSHSPALGQLWPILGGWDLESKSLTAFQLVLMQTTV